jgi:hypothetical protein
MAIRAGSKGGADPTGRGRKPRALPTPIPQRNRNRPVENPYPEKQEFRVGTFRVIEEKDDYLICRGFDPNAKVPFSQITPAAERTIKVAKPPLLQRTPWDLQEVSIHGITYNYEYSDDEFGVRTVRWTDESGNDQELEQKIDTPYFTDDLIMAEEVSMNPVVSGMEIYGTKAKDENGALLTWVDKNASGRHWQPPTFFDDARLPIGDRFLEKFADNTDIEDHKMDRGNGWEYRTGAPGDLTVFPGWCNHSAPGENAHVITYPDPSPGRLGGTTTVSGTSLSMTVTMGWATGDGAEVHIFMFFRVHDNDNLHFVQLTVRGSERRAVLVLYKVEGGITQQVQSKRTNWSASFGSVATLWLIDDGASVDYGVNLYNGGQVDYAPTGSEAEDILAALEWWQSPDNWPLNYIVDRFAIGEASGTQGVGFGARNFAGDYHAGTQFWCFTAGFGSLVPAA